MATPLLRILRQADPLEERLRHRLDEIGLCLDEQLRAWRPSALRKTGADWKSVDGYRFYRIPLHPGTCGLGVHPVQLHFHRDSERPSAKASGWAPDRPIPSLPPEILLSRCRRLLAAIDGGHLEFADDFEWEVIRVPIPRLKPAGYQGTGSPDRRSIPTRFRWVIVSETISPAELERYAEKLRTLLPVELRAAISLEVIAPVPADAALHRLIPAECIFLVGVKGARGDPLDQGSQSLLRRLDRFQFPYRLFADAARRNQHALRDQLPHLLALAGIQCRALQLIPEVERAVFIGIDLGRPKDRVHQSRLVLAAVDQEGRLLSYWSALQKLDERPDPKILARGLTWICGKIQHTLDRGTPIVILRDGRILDGESTSREAERAFPESTLLECIKHPTPIILDGEAPARPGTMLIHRRLSSSIALIQPPLGPVATHVSSALKLRLSSPRPAQFFEHLAAWTFQLCYGPMLGTRPSSLPAPIYWADGIGAVSETNHQFSGLHHVPHQEG
jgi:hypothetical protein